MASRKSPSAPEWQVILERIESQNRLTIEAVEVNRVVLEDRMQVLESNLGGRIGTLETAMTVVIGELGTLRAGVDTGSTAGWTGSTAGWTGSTAGWAGSKGASTVSRRGSRLARRCSTGAFP